MFLLASADASASSCTHTRFVVAPICLLLNCHFHSENYWDAKFVWKLRTCILAFFLFIVLHSVHYPTISHNYLSWDAAHLFLFFNSFFLFVFFSFKLQLRIIRVNLLLWSRNANRRIKMHKSEFLTQKTYSEKKTDQNKTIRETIGKNHTTKWKLNSTEWVKKSVACLMRRTSKVMCNLYNPPASGIEIAIWTVNTTFIHSHYSYEMTNQIGDAKYLYKVQIVIIVLEKYFILATLVFDEFSNYCEWILGIRLRPNV